MTRDPGSGVSTGEPAAGGGRRGLVVLRRVGAWSPERAGGGGDYRGREQKRAWRVRVHEEPPRPTPRATRVSEGLRDGVGGPRVRAPEGGAPWRPRGPAWASSTCHAGPATCWRAAPGSRAHLATSIRAGSPRSASRDPAGAWITGVPL